MATYSLGAINPAQSLTAACGVFKAISTSYEPLKARVQITFTTKLGFDILAYATDSETAQHGFWFEELMKSGGKTEDMYSVLSNRPLEFLVWDHPQASSQKVLLGGPIAGRIIRAPHNTIAIPMEDENPKTLSHHASDPITPLSAIDHEVYSSNPVGCIGPDGVTNNARVMVHGSVPKPMVIETLRLTLIEFPLARIIPQYYPFWNYFKEN